MPRTTPAPEVQIRGAPLRAQWYRRYGLSLLSEVAFGLAVPPSAGGQPDLEVTLRSPSRAGNTSLTGPVMAENTRPGGELLYTLVRQPSAYCLRWHGVADFEISDDVSALSCSEVFDAPQGIAAILLQSTVLAFIMALRGRFVLHASAVAIGGDVYALAGRSGSGKSTTAALICAGGGTLVADDEICVEEGRFVVGTGPGATLRLRNRAKSVIDLFPVRPPSFETADGRLAIQPSSAPDEPLPLSGVLFPTLSDEGSVLTAERLQGSEAVAQLVAAARIAGWREPTVQRRFFDGVVGLAKEVPLWRLVIPAGAGPTPVTHADLLDAMLRGGR